RYFNQLFIYSARPWDYVLPSVDHPLFGRYVESFVRTHLHGSNVFEQTLYLGIVPLGSVVAGFVLVFTRRMAIENQRLFLFFCAAALWMCFVSLPPKIG